MTTTHEQLRLVTTDVQPTINLTTFKGRKEVGDSHEKRVAEELRRRGWIVDRYGIEHFRPEITEAYSRTESPERWRSDFVAVRGLDIVYIDAKGSAESGARGRRRFVNRDCVLNQIKLHSIGLLPIYYVFDGFEVSTPNDVYERGKLGAHSPIGSGQPYYAINIEYCRSFNGLFGEPQRLANLRAVA